MSSTPTPALFPLWPEDAAWMGQARTLDVFLCDAAFVVADSVYIGPANGFTQREWREARVGLPAPALPNRVPELVATADLLGHEHALIAHYERIVAIAEASGRIEIIQQPFPYFALKPTLIAEGEILAHFSWSDDLWDTRPLLEALATVAPDDHGVIWDDQDQGWQIRIAIAGGRVFFVEWDAEGPPPGDAAYSVDAVTLSHQASGALERLKTLHEHLSAAFGHDYWTYRHGPEPPPRANGIRRIARNVLGVLRRCL